MPDRRRCVHKLQRHPQWHWLDQEQKWFHPCIKFSVLWCISWRWLRYCLIWSWWGLSELMQENLLAQCLDRINLTCLAMILITSLLTYPHCLIPLILVTILVRIEPVFLHVRQALCCWATPSSHFNFWFWSRILLGCPGWPWTRSFPSSTSRVAGISGRHHHALQLLIPFIVESYVLQPQANPALAFFIIFKIYTTLLYSVVVDGVIGQSVTV